MYATFVKSFEEPSSSSSLNNTSNFVHGGSLDPNNNKQTSSNDNIPKPYIPGSSNNIFKPPKSTAAAAIVKYNIYKLLALSARIKSENTHLKSKNMYIYTQTVVHGNTARDLARLKKESQKSSSRIKKKGGQRQIHLLFEEMKARQQGRGEFGGIGRNDDKYNDYHKSSRHHIGGHSDDKMTDNIHHQLEVPVPAPIPVTARVVHQN